MVWKFGTTSGFHQLNHWSLTFHFLLLEAEQKNFAQKVATIECMEEIAGVYVLLVFTILLVISVITLFIHVQKLRKTVEMLTRPFEYCNPFVTVVERRRKNKQKDPKTMGTPSPPPPRPLSGTCPWILESKESVVMVPSRGESPKEVFCDNDLSLLEVNTATCDTF